MLFQKLPYKLHDFPCTLIFLVGEMLEKFLWKSDYIFGLSLMPENQSSKNFSILTSRFEGQVQTACSHHSPSAKWSVYLIFTSAVASRLVISCTGYCVEWVRKKWPFQYITSKVCQATKPYPSKSNKNQNTICVNINAEGTLKSRINQFLQNGSLELNLTYLIMFY